MLRWRDTIGEVRLGFGRPVLIFVCAVTMVLAGWAVGSASGQTAAGPASGIAGRIVAGPTCPVEMVPPQPSCAPRPLSARVRITGSGAPARHWVVQSGRDGRFRIRLAPGTYTLQPLGRPGSPLPRPPGPSRVRVTRGRFTMVRIEYDTGIR